MTDRDDELARALGDLPVPDHAPDFWSRLDQQLEGRAIDAGPGAESVRAGTGPAPGGGRDHQHITVDGAHAGGGAVVPPRSGRAAGGRLPGSGGRDRGRSRALAAAAAAVVVLAGGAVLVGGRDGDGDDGDVVTVTDDGEIPTTGPPATSDAPDATVTPAPTEAADDGAPAPGPVGDPGTLGTVEAVGPGLVVAALPAADGSTTVLVQGLLAGDERGCEGAPLEGLQVLGPGGRARPVLSADGTAIVNGVDVVVSARGGRVAVISQCEGYLGQLLVGELGPDGVPTGLQVVAGSRADGTPVPGAPRAEAAPSLAWSPDGSRLLLTTAGSAAGGSAERALWSYEVASGTWSQRSDAPVGVVAAVERRDGSLVAVTEDALVAGDSTQPRRGVNGLALAPDGVTVAAYGSDGLLLVDETDGVGFLTTGQVNRVGFLPDGSWLAFSRYSEADEANEIAMLAMTGGQTEPAVLGRSVWGWFEVLADGSGLLVTVDGEVDADGFARPAVERWPFAG